MELAQQGVGGTTAMQIVCADAPFLSSPPVTEEKNVGFALPPRGDHFKAYQYLTGRGVCDEVLAFCFHTGRVYEMCIRDRMYAVRIL